MGKILSPKKNQPHSDLVYTPLPLAAEIINHYQPTGRILDPCRGKGAFYDQFPGQDNFWCEIEENRDFFQFTEPVDWIITNPPWSKIRAFMLHGMTISQNIVFLAVINHFVTKARLRDLQDQSFCIREIYGVPTPPKPWPPSGFQLAAVHLTFSPIFEPVIFSGVFGQ